MFLKQRRCAHARGGRLTHVKTVRPGPPKVTGFTEGKDSMSPDWILVADAAQARLLQQEAGATMTVIHAFHHPASRAHSSALGADERGRQKSDRSFGGAAFEARVEPQRKEHLRFARELAQFLEEGAVQGRCRALRVFAPSPFLGELKAELGPRTQRLLAGSHDLDLTAFGLDEVERRVQEFAAATPRP